MKHCFTNQPPVYYHIKKIICTLCFTFIACLLQAQVLYGTTTTGGANNGGAIVKLVTATNTLTAAFSFNGSDGASSYGSLIQTSDGKLYGMTAAGGSNNAGVIFSYDPSTSIYTKLKDFDYYSGYSPYGSLMQISDGKLYGMTYTGGSYDYGVIFSYDPSILVYTKLKDFDYTNGGYPVGSLMQASDGKLYGVTSDGGSHGNGEFHYGVIFSYDPSNSVYTKLYDFDDINGVDPLGSLIQASDGKLYGMTYGGGSKGYGVIFSFDPSTLVYTKLKDFDYTNGSVPEGSLIQASDGKLYGMTYGGGNSDFGVIFYYDPSNSVYTKLKDFDYANGASPSGSLIQASNGKLYGMTYEGGSNNYGVSFSYDLSTSIFTKFADFNGVNGSSPTASFIELCAKETTYYHDADGDGYGNAADSVQSCSPPAGYVTDNTDCNDTMASAHPGAKEICGNGIDDNCNGEIDEGCTGIQISIADNSVIEGDHGVKLMRFKVNLSNKSPRKVIVRYATQNGTATAGSDYVAQNGIIVFPPGLTNIISGILIKGDKIPEANETFNIVLHSAVNATIADSTGTFTILDNDGELITAATEQQNAVNVVKAVKVSPNPAQGKVNIMLTGYSGNVIIKLNSIDGRTLQQHKVQVSLLKPLQQQFDVSSYADGMYFITVIDEKGEKKTQKFMIDK